MNYKHSEDTDFALNFCSDIKDVPVITRCFWGRCVGAKCLCGAKASLGRQSTRCSRLARGWLMRMSEFKSTTNCLSLKRSWNYL